ncbi:MAG TPA: SDR family NAD(P)-dependent oxidoreductase [Polyangiaceae bacterium]|jgi:3-oxoacyl-[acyl-carrier protein] reductase|nr:SDR family NAD(P)-dependent oxidoreductase [Polyangiaceae bacterium]
MSFSGKSVLVTGGAMGIGQGIALAFARLGANVAITHMTSDPTPTVEQIKALGGKALALKADLREEKACDDIVQQTIKAFGDLDIFVANTGGLLKRSRVVETPLELWNEAIAVNLTSTFLCCRAALRHMEPKKKGNIILISSLAAHDGGGFGASHYAATKGAMLTYTRALAKEVGPLGIRVNGIAPGLIATRFHDTFTPAEARKATVERTPLRREGTPEDVAGAAVFLASEGASFLAGETIEVNGGLGLY